jgi:hypothetical protein
MKFIIVSIFNDKFKDLADITHYNKELYAKKHGYMIQAKTKDFEPNFHIYFEKMRFILKLFNEYKDLDWAFWIDCDAMITNFNIKLEEIVDNDYHLIISKDINNINAGCYFIRNSYEGKEYMNMMINNNDKYFDHIWGDQQCIIDSYETYKNIIKILPQKKFNSYDYNLYSHLFIKDENWYKAYNDGNWEKGDFVIHWPGIDQNHRILMAKNMLNNINNT